MSPNPFRPLAALAVAAALSACAAAVPEGLEYEHVEVAAARNFAFSYSETPFVNGPMSVVATENGRLRTYRFVPCQGGATVCAGGLYGRAGQLTVGPDYHVIRGLYGNRTFWLSPGGDGAIGYADGTFVPLAWDSIDQPVGAWETARLTEGPMLNGG